MTAEKEPALTGRRVTKQRRLLLEIIRQAEGHLDADELFRWAKEREPRISFSTVYRNLQLFKQLGLVEERHFLEEHHHYEPKDFEEHHHLVCLGCGQVLEFQTPLIKRMKNKVAKKKGFEISRAEVFLEGYCPRCQEKGGHK